jgi:predicted anti-sigma-YlaC factor YlaD
VRPLALAACLLATVCATGAGCVRSIAINAAADALAGSGGAFARDDDPRLVRDAIPFALKTIEGLVDAAPEHPGLLLSAASGFTQYAYAFVRRDAELLDEERPSEAKPVYARARKLYRRARAYGMRGLDVHAEGFAAEFRRDRRSALARLEAGAVPLLYWTAVAWAAEISISKDDAKVLGEQPDMEALMARALALDPDWGEGAIHEFYIAYDGGRSEAIGGSVARAKDHYDAALRLSKGRRVGPHVSWAESVEVQRQDKKKFLELLDRALAYDVDESPETRLVNILSQERARWLKGRVEDLFAE